MTTGTQDIVPVYRKDGKLSLRVAVAYVHNIGRAPDKLMVSVYIMAQSQYRQFRLPPQEMVLAYCQTIPASTSEDDQRKLQEALLIAVASRYDADFHLTRKITVRKPIKENPHGVQRSST